MTVSHQISVPFKAAFTMTWNIVQLCVCVYTDGNNSNNGVKWDRLVTSKNVKKKEKESSNILECILHLDLKTLIIDLFFFVFFELLNIKGGASFCQNAVNSKVELASLNDGWGTLWRRRCAFPQIKVWWLLLCRWKAYLYFPSHCVSPDCVSLQLKIETQHSESTSYTAFSITCPFGLICCCLLASNSERQGQRQRETKRGRRRLVEVAP